MCVATEYVLVKRVEGGERGALACSGERSGMTSAHEGRQEAGYEGQPGLVCVSNFV